MNKRQLTIEDIPEFIFGFEGADGGDGGDPDGDEGDGEDGDDEDGGDDSDGSDGDEGDEHDDANDPKVRGLKKALADERKAVKALERENKKLAKAQKERELAEKGEVEEKTQKLTAAEEKLERVAKGYRDTKLNAAITKAAEKAGFIDPEDAIAGVDTTDLVDQDDDDPSDVDIDEAELTSRIKKLAAKKPHFLKKGTDDGEPTGSQFGGGKGKQPKKDSKESWKDAYPNL